MGCTKAHTVCVHGRILVVMDLNADDSAYTLRPIVVGEKHQCTRAATKLEDGPFPLLCTSAIKVGVLNVIPP